MSEVSDEKARFSIPNRRDFIRGLGTMALGGVTGIITAKRFLPPHETTPATTPEKISEETHEITTPSGVRIILNDQDLPVRCILPDKRVIKFDPEIVKKVRREAISGTEAQVLDVFHLPTGSIPTQEGKVERQNNPYRPNPTLEEQQKHPRPDKLPEDILSDQELEEKGIRIIQADGAKLHIRKGAFDEGQPFYAFDKNRRKLIIALVDTPNVSTDSLEDPRYKDLKGRINITYKKSEIEAFKNKTIDSLEDFREYVKRLAEDPVRASAFERAHPAYLDVYPGLNPIDAELIKLKQEQYIFRHDLLSQDEMASYTNYSTGGGWEGIGFYSPPIDGRAAIFVAVGNKWPRKDFATLYFTPQGNFEIAETTSLLDNIGPTSRAPFDRNQGYPSPEDFKMNAAASPDHPESYPYGAQTPGQVLRHEVEHDFLMSAQSTSNNSEYDADMGAMEGIRQAHERWLTTGDNLGYCFVFETPEGIILTSNKARNKSLETNL